MTSILIENKSNEYVIRCYGHASGSGETCAGISAIMYAFAGYLRNNEKRVRNLEQILDSGYALIRYQSRSEKVKAAFEMTAIGLKQIALSYPEYAKIEEN